MKNGTLKAVWDSGEMVFEDFRTGFGVQWAISKGVNDFPTTVKILEKHGSRWYNIGEVKEGKLIPKGKKKEYYVLPTDQYGQPSGYIQTVPMYKVEMLLKEYRGAYIFDNYVSACYRAMD